MPPSTLPITAATAPTFGAGPGRRRITHDRIDHWCADREVSEGIFLADSGHMTKVAVFGDAVDRRQMRRLRRPNGGNFGPARVG
jgi:hypothetical protein